MSPLRTDPIRAVPKRVLLLSSVITLIIIVVSLFFQWSLGQALIGFWLGVVINLINFRIIILGSKSFLEKAEAGKKASMTPNITIRYILYGVGFLVAWRVGIPALIASFIGSTMVSTAFKLDGFFSFGYDKENVDNEKIPKLDEDSNGSEVEDTEGEDTKNEDRNIESKSPEYENIEEDIEVLL